MRIVVIDEHRLEFLFGNEANSVGITAALRAQAEVREDRGKRLSGLVVFRNQQCAE
jgi:hypothetical protein